MLLSFTPIEIFEQRLRSNMTQAQTDLQKAQETQEGLMPALLGREGAMISDSTREIQSIAVVKALKAKYRQKLADRGGIDQVLKELELYIVNEKLKDRKFSVDPLLRATKNEDFIKNADGSIKARNDNLNERGRYKAALRSIKDKMKSGNFQTANEVSFGTIFHEGSEVSFGPSFGKGPEKAREVLAYVWLAASDLDMELSEEKIEEIGSREKCVEAEKDNLLNVLAEIQRAHNDGSYSPFERELDNPSCDAGAWTRLVLNSTLNNQFILNIKGEGAENKVLSTPGEILTFDIHSRILERIKGLSAQDKIALLNNYNREFVFTSATSSELVGFDTRALVKYLERDTLLNFDNYWDELIENNATLRTIYERSQQFSRTGQNYAKALESQRKYYKSLWDVELAKILSGNLHQDHFYEPLEKFVYEDFLSPAFSEANQALELHTTELKQRLLESTRDISELKLKIEELNSKIQTLTDFDDIQAGHLLLEELSDEYTSLVQEKKRILGLIEQKAKRLAVKSLMNNISLLTMTKDQAEIDGYIDAIVPEPMEEKGKEKEDKEKEIEEEIEKEPIIIEEQANTAVEIDVKAITLKEIEDRPQYAFLLKANMSPEAIQKRFLKQILLEKNPSLENDYDKLDNLIEQWINYQKTNNQKILSDVTIEEELKDRRVEKDVSSQETFVLMPSASTVINFDFHYKQIQINERGNGRELSDRELTELTLKHLGYSQSSKTRGWFNDRANLIQKGLKEIPEKVKYTEREYAFMKKVKEISNLNSYSIEELMAQVIDKFPITEEEDIHFKKLADSFRDYQAGVRSIDDGEKESGVNSLVRGARNNSMEAKYALVLYSYNDPQINELVKRLLSSVEFKNYANEIRSRDFKLNSEERTILLNTEQERELIAIEKRIALYSNLELIGNPPFSEVKQVYLEALERVLTDEIFQSREEARKLHLIAMEAVEKAYGQDSQKNQEIAELKESRLSELFFLVAHAKLNHPDTIQEGMTILSRLAVLGNQQALTELYKNKKLVLYRADLERQASFFKKALLNCDPTDKDKLKEKTQVYLEALQLASDAGSDSARLTLIQIAFDDGVTLPELEDLPLGFMISFSDEVMNNLTKLKGGRTIRRDDAAQMLKDMSLNSVDPKIRSEAKNLLHKWLDENYIAYKKADVFDKPISDLIFNAKLDHGLAKLEIISRATMGLTREYSIIFGKSATKPLSNLTDFEELTKQSLDVYQALEPADKLEGKKILDKIKANAIEDEKGKINKRLQEVEIMQKNHDFAGANQELALIKKRIEELRDKEIDLSFDLVLPDLVSFKNAINRGEVNPGWLTRMKAVLEEDELTIRLAAGAIQYQMQASRNKVIDHQITHYLNQLKDPLQKFKAAENDYYTLLREEDLSEAELEEKIKEIVGIKNSLQDALQEIKVKFMDEFREFDLTTQDKEYIDRVLIHHIPPDSTLTDPLLAKTHNCIVRTQFILECHNNHTTILDKAHQELLELIDNYMQQLDLAKNQVAQSAQRGAKSKANRQLQKLIEAQNALDNIKNDFLIQPQKGFETHEKFTDKLAKISVKLENDLNEVGSLTAVSKLRNTMLNKLNSLFKRIGMPFEFKLNTALTATQKDSLNQDLVRTHLEAAEKTAETSNVKKIKRKVGVYFARSNIGSLKYGLEDLEKAKHYIDSNLDVDKLQLSFKNEDGTENDMLKQALKELFSAGAVVEIKQLKGEPIRLNFNSLDGTKTISIDVSDYLFNQFIEKQKAQMEYMPKADHSHRPTNSQ